MNSFRVIILSNYRALFFCPVIWPVFCPFHLRYALSAGLTTVSFRSAMRPGKIAICLSRWFYMFLFNIAIFYAFSCFSSYRFSGLKPLAISALAPSWTPV